MPKDRPGRFSERAGRNASKRRAGLEKTNAEADPPRLRGKAANNREAGDASTGWLRRGIGDGMRARGRHQQHGKPCRWRARAHREPARASLGRQGGGEARSSEEAGEIPAERRGLSSGATQGRGKDDGDWR